MIFVDTSFFYPLFSENDVDHKRVREVLEAYRGRRLADLFLTTNYVVSETITLIRTTPPRSHACGEGRRTTLQREASRASTGQALKRSVQPSNI